jgi:hypothetical protein
MSNETIDKVIELCSKSADTDNPNAARKAISSYYTGPKAEPEVIRATIINELGRLLSAIAAHANQEFLLLPEIFDAKYGHLAVYEYICSRWFTDVKNVDDLPGWYISLIAIANDKKAADRTVRTLATKTLQSLVPCPGETKTTKTEDTEKHKDKEYYWYDREYRCSMTRHDAGYWCGYVALPAKHPLLKDGEVDKDAAKSLKDGGISFVGKVTIGFDAGASPIYRDFDFVQQELRELVKQLENYGKL